MQAGAQAIRRLPVSVVIRSAGVPESYVTMTSVCLCLDHAIILHRVWEREQSGHRYWESLTLPASGLPRCSCLKALLRACFAG